jgi:hypothetical protein
LANLGWGRNFSRDLPAGKEFSRFGKADGLAIVNGADQIQQSGFIQDRDSQFFRLG